jgi:hypothetical protein
MRLNSGITVLWNAWTSIAARLWALIRSRRESPEPFSITSSGISSAFFASQLRTTPNDLSNRPGGRAASAPSVR